MFTRHFDHDIGPAAGTVIGGLALLSEEFLALAQAGAFQDRRQHHLAPIALHLARGAQRIDQPLGVVGHLARIRVEGLDQGLDLGGLTHAFFSIIDHPFLKTVELFSQGLEQDLQTFGALLVHFCTTGLENFGSSRLEGLGQFLAGFFELGEFFVMMADGGVVFSAQAGELGVQLALLGLDGLELLAQTITLLDRGLDARKGLAGFRQRRGLAIRLVAQLVAFELQLLDLRRRCGTAIGRLANQNDNQQHEHDAEAGEQKKSGGIHGVDPNLMGELKPSTAARTKAVACN